MHPVFWGGGNPGKVIKLCNGVLLDKMKMQIFLFSFVNEGKVSPASLTHAELLQTFEKNTDNLYFSLEGGGRRK